MKKGRILYLDDEIELLEFVKFVLERYDYEVLVGEKWDEKYFDELRKVDMVILDIMFPEGQLNGYDICKKIREKEEYKGIPIYMFSAKAFSEDKEEAGESGANGFIEKPVPVEELVSIVNSVVKKEYNEVL